MVCPMCVTTAIVANAPAIAAAAAGGLAAAKISISRKAAPVSAAQMAKPSTVAKQQSGRPAKPEVVNLMVVQSWEHDD